MKRISSVSSAPLHTAAYRTKSLRYPPVSFECLHTTASKGATPFPITVNGPPPAAPVPEASQYGERVDRRRRQAELLRRGQDMRISQMKPGTAMKKRFWKDVSVQIDDGISLYLPLLIESTHGLRLNGAIMTLD